MIPVEFQFRGQVVNGVQYVMIQDVVLALGHAAARTPEHTIVLLKLKEEFANMKWSNPKSTTS